MLADMFGPDGLIVIAVVVVVLLFGGTRLPKLARGLGSASHEFKKGMEEGDPDKDKGDSAASKGDDKTSGPIQSN
jgi:sec-independent protein translocase protein TatA